MEPKQSTRRLAAKILVGLFGIATLLGALLFLMVFLDIGPLKEHDTPNCLGADTIEFLDSATVGGKRYRLVAVTSGISDKITFIALFAKDTRFDACGKPDTAALDAVDIDYGPEHGPVVQWLNRIEVRGNAISIHYAGPPQPRPALIDVPVDWRD